MTKSLNWLAAALAVCLLACEKTPAPARAPSPPADAQALEAFLARHWQRPLPPQGTPPAALPPEQTSLAPEACGQCHATQFAAWQGSRHAQAMGPGIVGQLAEMDADDTDAHQACIRCHAPLAEQAASLAAAIRSGRGLLTAGGVSRPLHQHGMSCAACHVRGYQWFGPPRRDGSAPSDPDRFPHRGWVASRAFEDSRFCAACHQFEVDEFALNGKPIENTWAEWQASRHAVEGRSCQACHMPDRQHLWRGIHDPEMTRRGVDIDAGAPLVEAGKLSAALTLRNRGTGHHFPTYVTPKVIVEGFQEDAAGKMLAGTRRQLVIARQVALDLSAELADTRIAADASATLAYRATLAKRAKNLVFRVRVEPDAFYTEFYRATLADASAAKGRALIEQALADSLASAYVLYESRQAIPRR